MSLSCQRCGHALRIDDSLTNLDQASADVLLAPLEDEVQATLHPSQPIPQALHTRLIGIKPPNLQPSNSLQLPSKRDSLPAPSESFVVLPHPTDNTSNIQSSTKILQAVHPTTHLTWMEDGHWPRNNTLSHRLRVANRVFDIMSSKSSVDHPMCQECTDMLLENLQKQMMDVGKERDCYIDFLKKVQDSRVSPDEEEGLARQVDELVLAEKEAEDELDKLKQEEQALDSQLQSLQDQMQRLDKEEQGFWEQCNQYQISLQTFQNERDSINLKYDHDVKQYERLQKTVVYNDAFCISHDGPFGTINGFRLGKLSTHPVEWNEINAAWGQTLLLLYTVASKLKFQFKTYRLVPMGSFSRIEKIDGDSVVSYELYGSGDFGINKMLFLNRRFDHAMVAVLNCLKQLTDFAEERDKTLRLPYRINKDRIGELSIRIQFNQLEQWTKALKYMLTNMKWILVFASRANTTTVE
ncbi:autophagy protein Apg6-domain-containing protein [Gilbertella persicaria]|uniref:autophagy protein Apg6-domain-containing protein n=1 Tax=Gilbertella persicaria TaxID=101096 RepID=UPI002220B64F|nr:autophagy protein Apg6-domain-containing protein [Gilbertella persicaria]KAI8067644.1 autophagy protein Apg6-domain-containing protein [Gilbertella persicaria]